jgi:hypothetical protein
MHVFPESETISLNIQDKSMKFSHFVPNKIIYTMIRVLLFFPHVFYLNFMLYSQNFWKYQEHESTHGSTLRQHQTKIGTQPIQRKSRLLLVFKLSWVLYNLLPKTCTGTKINCSISQLLK